MSIDETGIYQSDEANYLHFTSTVRSLEHLLSALPQVNQCQ